MEYQDIVPTISPGRVAGISTLETPKAKYYVANKDAFYANIHWGYIIIGVLVICLLCCCSSSSIALFRNEITKMLGYSTGEGFKSIKRKKRQY